MIKIPLSMSARKKVRNLLLAGKKIQAIKEVRLDAQCSLKDAKNAVENYMSDNNLMPPNIDDSAQLKRYKNNIAQIVPKAFIKSVKVCVGEGIIEVDLEEAKFRVLTELGDIGLDDARQILHLIETLERFDDESKWSL